MNYETSKLCTSRDLVPQDILIIKIILSIVIIIKNYSDKKVFTSVLKCIHYLTGASSIPGCNNQAAWAVLPKTNE